MIYCLFRSVVQTIEAWVDLQIIDKNEKTPCRLVIQHFWDW